MIVNRRIEARTRVFQGASVVFNGRQSVLACTVRNWSQTGAMVRMADWIALPEAFELDIAHAQGSVRVRQCWRHGDDVGVVFIPADEQRSCEVVSLDQARLRRQSRSGVQSG